MTWSSFKQPIFSCSSSRRLNSFEAVPPTSPQKPQSLTIPTWWPFSFWSVWKKFCLLLSCSQRASKEMAEKHIAYLLVLMRKEKKRHVFSNETITEKRKTTNFSINFSKEIKFSKKLKNDNYSWAAWVSTTQPQHRLTNWELLEVKCFLLLPVSSAVCLPSTFKVLHKS